MRSVTRSGMCLCAAVLLLVMSVPALAGQEPPAARPGEARDVGQQPKPAPQLPRTPAPGPPEAAPQPPDQRQVGQRQPEGRPVNLQVEVTITDQVESEPAQKKTVSMIVADRTFGRIRASGQALTPGNFVPVQLNVDATPTIQPNDSIRLQLTLEYRPAPQAPGSDASRPPHSTLNESLTVILQPGKPLTVSRAVDPFTNRRTSVDVTATIMK